MTERERLIDLLEKGQELYYDSYGQAGVLYKEFIADYLLANGVIVPPCKLGDMAYRISEENPETGEDELCVRECGAITAIAYSDNDIYVTTENIKYALNSGGFAKVGENYAYLSREQTEKALRKRQNETD